MGRALAAVLLLLGWAHAARAEAPDEKTERARVHLKAAVAYYDEARYDDAAREMEVAYQLKPLPDLQYNLAQCYERLGRYDQAASAYEQYLKGNPSAVDRKLVQTRVANLRARAAATAAGSQAPPPAPANEKVVFKTIVVYKEAPALPGRGVRISAYGLGVLALGALASGVAFAVLAKQQSDIVELPTELQHGVAKAVAAVMNLLLPTAEDHLQVIAMMLSAAHLSAMIISDDVDTGFYEALLERTGRVAHSVCLDMYGTHDLHSVAYRHDPQGAAYRARVSLDDLGPA